MSPRRPPDDDPLWDEVTRHVKPLRGRAVPAKKPLPRPTPLPTSEPKRKPPPPAPSPPKIELRPAPPRSVRVPAIEPRLVKSIRRGHTPIEHRLDLHGRTQAQAHRQLEQTLSAARARGQKLVLVVTGTGLRRRLEGLGDGLDPRPADGSEPGVLRRNLSHWLSQPPMGDWVLGLSPAGPEHGGAGAFYLLLRRAR